MNELRPGRWQDVLSDVTCDAYIGDPPYGSRTHEGHADGMRPERFRPGESERSQIAYDSWTPDDVRAFVAHWAPRTRGWMACMTSDDLVGVYREAYREAGRLDFAPVPILQHRPRLSGDGPGSCAVYLMVARPRQKRFLSWGSLPGWYMSRPSHDGVCGGKPLDLMRLIVADYSRPGDLVADATAGGGTTLLAARMEGRSYIGAECLPAHHEIAQRRLAEFPVDATGKQASLF